MLVSLLPHRHVVLKFQYYHPRTCIAARLATEGLDWQDAFKLDSQLTDEER